MTKLSYMLLGVVTGGAVALAVSNKDMIEKKMRMMQRESKRAINKVKHML